jgi:hypothetical protein
MHMNKKMQMAKFQKLEKASLKVWEELIIHDKVQLRIHVNFLKNVW